MFASIFQLCHFVFSPPSTAVITLTQSVYLRIIINISLKRCTYALADGMFSSLLFVPLQAIIISKLLVPTGTAGAHFFASLWQ